MSDPLETRFILEPIEPEWDRPPQREKTPRCPDRIVWGERTLAVAEVLSEWKDFERRGRMASNMRPEHAARARVTGSWGVGRFYYRVRLDDGRVYDIYYDRAPKGSDQRKGAWFIKQEILNQP